MRRLRLCLLACGIAAALAGCRNDEPPAPAGATAPTPAPTPGQVVLFFPDDDTLLHRERREVPELPEGAAGRARVALEELAAGSAAGHDPVFTWPVAIAAVFVDREGNAYVDLNAPPAEAVAGSAGELAFVYGVVNTVVANAPGVARVQLLFDGREVESLGHLDLTHPLAPDPRLIAR